MRRHKKQQVVTKKRTVRTRARILGTSTRPRLSIFRSNKGLYVQLIDDASGKTVVSSSVRDAAAAPKGMDLTPGRARAFELGKQIADKAVKAGVSEVVFDRGSYRYHGRVQSFADGARDGGLKF